ncbi:ankyrin repeat domain-containing protein [Gottfriedia sp. NPDC056225]|uniref:ankyrin repeat domain-containing protein n=1 Tax=Gottfriedia sp. NPDC056225 TaxID=3345751 RepID=UPI001559A222|nr:ankyrin repeat domain-containing protein [Arthrobacter citreus]
MEDLISKLFDATEKGEVSEVNEILGDHQDLIHNENEHGLTLLGIAAHYGQFEVVKTLVKNGAEINAISNSKLSFIPKNTALHAAIAGAKSKEVIDFLLANGADPNLCDREGHTPLHIAAFEGNTAIAELLLKNGAKLLHNNSGKTPIEIAEERGNLDFINFIKEVSI